VGRCERARDASRVEAHRCGRRRGVRCARLRAASPTRATPRPTARAAFPVARGAVVLRGGVATGHRLCRRLGARPGSRSGVGAVRLLHRALDTRGHPAARGSSTRVLARSGTGRPLTGAAPVGVRAADRTATPPRCVRPRQTSPLRRANSRPSRLFCVRAGERGLCVADCRTARAEQEDVSSHLDGTSSSISDPSLAPCWLLLIAQTSSRATTVKGLLLVLTDQHHQVADPDKAGHPRSDPTSERRATTHHRP
jgi:hypothetical protein